MSVVDQILHYQRNIEKSSDNDDRILHCISKLHNLPVTVQHLEDTGVGRTVNNLRKYNGTVGIAAKALVAKWKVMVAHKYANGDISGEDEDEVSDVSYADDLKLTESEKDIIPDLIETLESEEDIGNKKEMSETHNNMSHSSKSSATDKHRKHEKSKHSSKHHTESETKHRESKSSKSSSRKDKAHKEQSRNLEKMAIKVEADTRKRSLDSSSSSKSESKKRKMLDNRNDDETLQSSALEKNHSSARSSEIKIKENDKDFKHEKKISQDELKSGTNKHKSQDTSNKSRDSSEKHKKEEHSSDKKLDRKKDLSHRSSKIISDSKVSSSKDHVKCKDEDKKTKHKDDKSKHEKKKDTKIRLTQEIISDKGIDCNSGASFAEALGMCTIPQPSKKRSINSSSTNKLIKVEPMSPPNKKKVTTTSTRTEPECDNNPNPLALLAPNVKLEPLNVDLASTLPEISPNYKPLPHVNPTHRKEEIKHASEMIYVKNQRTKVYSGNKVGYTSVPTLSELCMRVLIENIDALEFTGGVPYDILKPVLERATSDQLFILENYNAYLIGDTDSLWQFHCNREFRNKQRQELETWRDMYMRCLDEREAKLKILTANIKQSIDKSVPVRSTKLAYMDHVVKPPRNVLKKQAKYGTANATPATVSSVKKKLTGGKITNNATDNIVVPPPPMSRFKTSTSSSSVKKTKAPLMAKALQLIKGRYKR